MKKNHIIGIAGLFIFYACSKNKTTVGENPETPLDCSIVTAKTFTTDVSLIIQSKCATDGNCH
ncbi:MAG: hypothetical protein JST09_02425, partial [Bacteroidetes bacterium]|nr:hypothetical protein [Bacteroidota bacterium]